jgi:GT2 family glycosyltransferase/spore maturation protein CgeB
MQLQRDSVAREAVTAGDVSLQERLTMLARCGEHMAAQLEQLRSLVPEESQDSPTMAAVEALQEEVTRARRVIDELSAPVRRATGATSLARGSDALGRRSERLGDELGGESVSSRASLAAQRTRARDLEQLVSVLVSTLQSAHGHFTRIEKSRAWRWGHRISVIATRLTLRRPKTSGAVRAGLRTVERGLEVVGSLEEVVDGPESTPDAIPVPPDEGEQPGDRAARDELAGELRRRLGPVSRPATLPRVSCIVLNRNGRHHLERLFAALDADTDYPDLELVVVDNASTDDSIAWLREREWVSGLRVLQNDLNVSFSQANNQAFDLATGELLLFLNNDIVPFEPGWLQEMVVSLNAENVAVGATLIYPRPRDETWMVQHRGVRFHLRDGYLKGVNVGEQTPLLGSWFGEDAVVPSASAACLLIARSDFEAVGGFHEEYRYGTEDVELGLRLAEQGGRSVCAGRAVVVHNESSTQRVEGRDFMRLNRIHNRRVFLSRWSARVRREVLLSRLSGDHVWSEVPLHVAITVSSLDQHDGYGDWPTAHELGYALEALGWRVTYVERKQDRWYSVPDGVDHLIVLLDAFDARRIDPGIVTVAWIRNWTKRWASRPWFDRLDVLLASSDRAVQLIKELTGRHAELFPLATNPERFFPRPATREFACDYVFTGSYFDRPRAVQRSVDPRPGERFVVYGKNWERTEDFARWSRGHLAYERLPDAYASAKIVIDDAAEHAGPDGSVNSRVFDALAAGALPVSNCIEGVRALFGPQLPVWSSRWSLRAVLDSLLSDEKRRRELVAPLREKVLEEHTYAHRATRLREILHDACRRPSFCLKIGAPSWKVAERWGDLYFARAVGRELARRGHRFHIQTLDEWDDEVGLGFDVVVHLRGLSRYTPRPGQFNVMWHLSHPDDVGVAELAGYDLVLVASESHGATLGDAISVPTVVVEQATDPRVFYPDPDPALARELVFVGNSRKVRRRIIEDVLPTDRDLAIWGGDWEDMVDPRLVAAKFVPNDEVRRIYSSAGLVLCDHWDDMRGHGFISNRIYDALACGAVVVSDHVPGIERFGDAVVTYDSREDLSRVIDELLDDRGALRGRGERGRERVLREHTFEHRVDALLHAIREQMTATGHRLAVRA